MHPPPPWLVLPPGVSPASASASASEDEGEGEGEDETAQPSAAAAAAPAAAATAPRPRRTGAKAGAAAVRGWRVAAPPPDRAHRAHRAHSAPAPPTSATPAPAPPRWARRAASAQWPPLAKRLWSRVTRRAAASPSSAANARGYGKDAEAPDEAPLSWRDASLVAALVARRADEPRFALDAALDGVLGAAAVAWALSEWERVAELAHRAIGLGFGVESESLRARVEWVLSRHAPLGLKLNPYVDQVLGHTVILFLDAWLALTSWLAPAARPAALLFLLLATLASAGGGLSVALAVAHDCTCVLMLHVSALHGFLSRLLRAQLALMDSLALLMRGRKRNVLRNRVDTLRTDGAQFFLGTTVFIVLLFTLQTTLAHHWLVLLAWGAVAVVQRALLACCVGAQTFPWARVLRLAPRRVRTVVLLPTTPAPLAAGRGRADGDAGSPTKWVVTPVFASASDELGEWGAHVLRLASASEASSSGWVRFLLGAALLGEPVRLPPTRQVSDELLYHTSC